MVEDARRMGEAIMFELGHLSRWNRLRARLGLVFLGVGVWLLPEAVVEMIRTSVAYEPGESDE